MPYPKVLTGCRISLTSKRGFRCIRYRYSVHIIAAVTGMRGSDAMQESLFMVARLEDFVPGDHPLRRILELINVALSRLDGLFEPPRVLRRLFGLS